MTYHLFTWQYNELATEPYVRLMLGLTCKIYPVSLSGNYVNEVGEHYMCTRTREADAQTAFYLFKDLSAEEEIILALKDETILKCNNDTVLYGETYNIDKSIVRAARDARSYVRKGYYCDVHRLVI